MKYKNLLLLLCVIAGFFMGFLGLLRAPVANADHVSCYNDTSATPAEIQTCVNAKADAAKAICRDGRYDNEVSPEVHIAACESQYSSHYGKVPEDGLANPNRYEGDCNNEDLSQDCGIVKYIVDFTRVLSGLVGIVIVIMVAVGGVQFSTAGDNPQAVAAARQRIINALIALLLYMFSFAFLQWIVPGGIV